MRFSCKPQQWNLFTSRVKHVKCKPAVSIKHVSKRIRTVAKMPDFAIYWYFLTVISFVIQENAAQVTELNLVTCGDDPEVRLSGGQTRTGTSSIATFTIDIVPQRYAGSLKDIHGSSYPVIDPLSFNRSSTNLHYSFQFSNANDNFTFGFHEFLYFRHRREGWTLEGFSQDWTGCPSPLCYFSTLDAATNYMTGVTRIAIFRGYFTWRIEEALAQPNSEQGVPNYHKAQPISKEFPGVPPYLDAAFSVYMRATNVTVLYFFKDDHVYQVVDRQSPQKDTKQNKFAGLTASVDAAFETGNQIFLLAGLHLYVYRFDTIHPAKRFENFNKTDLKPWAYGMDASYVENELIYLFRNWRVRTLRRNDTRALIQDHNKEITPEFTFKSVFHCPDDMYRGRPWGVRDYESYVTQYAALLAPHSEELWQRTGQVPPDPWPVILSALILLGILLTANGTAVFVCIVSVQKTKRRKLVELTGGRIDPKKIEKGEVTGDELIASGMVTPSALFSGTGSKISQGGPDATPSQLIEMGYSPSQLVEAGMATPSTLPTTQATPSTLMKMGYSPSQLVDAGIATPSRVGMPQASPSTLMKMGYTASQLVEGGIATPSRVGYQPPVPKTPQPAAQGFTVSQLLAAGVTTPSKLALLQKPGSTPPPSPPSTPPQSAGTPVQSRGDAPKLTPSGFQGGSVHLSRVKGAAKADDTFSAALAPMASGQTKDAEASRLEDSFSTALGKGSMVSASKASTVKKGGYMSKMTNAASKRDSNYN